MKIQRASHLGWCFGVRDAVGLAKTHAAQGPITSLGELVHNAAVLEDLRQHGVMTRHDAGDVSTRRVLVTAHGASRRRLEELARAGFEVTEATCPLVHRAHAALDDLVRRGLHPVIVGLRDHVEVRGLAEDHPGCDIVLSESDVDAIVPRGGFGVVAQTTQPVARVRALVARLVVRFPDSQVVFRDTVCQPTKDRQNAAVELARASDVVVVVGGSKSNNTRELVATCSRHCTRVHHVDAAAELRPEWFSAGDRVGLTAGTSTPDERVDAVEEWLQRMAKDDVEIHGNGEHAGAAAAARATDSGAR